MYELLYVCLTTPLSIHTSLKTTITITITTRTTTARRPSETSVGHCRFADTKLDPFDSKFEKRTTRTTTTSKLRNCPGPLFVRQAGQTVVSSPRLSQRARDRRVDDLPHSRQQRFFPARMVILAVCGHNAFSFVACCCNPPKIAKSSLD
jgi:hypothetical protein